MLNAHQQQGGTPCHIVLLLLNGMDAKTMCTIVVMMISNFVEFVEQKKSRGRGAEAEAEEATGSYKWQRTITAGI